jgi:membrane-bound lytic murein transglycosylase B
MRTLRTAAFLAAVLCHLPNTLYAGDDPYREGAIIELSKHFPEDYVRQQLNHRDACSAYVLPQQQYLTLAQLRTLMMSEESLAAGEWYAWMYDIPLDRLTGDDAYLRYYVLAVLRIESDFGRNLGTMPALRTFYNEYRKLRASDRLTRANWVLTAHVVPLLSYARALDRDPCTIYGSHAGAIGMPQFMPFSLDLARDGDENGHIDLEQSMSDAMASVVSFFRNRRWGQRPRFDVLRRYCGAGHYAERYAAIAEEYALTLKKRVEEGHH